MNSTSWIWALVAVIIIGGGAWWYLSNNNTTQPAATTTEQTTGTETSGSQASTGSDQGMQDNGVTGSVSAGVGTLKTVTITYGANGFSPANVTINKGDTVSFINQSGGNMWVASDAHPTHAEFDGTSRAEHCAAGYSGPTPFDQCTSGSSYSFTFTKTGTFNFHNHVAAQFGGKIVVQ